MMAGRLLVAAALLTVALAPAARASERSAALVSRGLVAYHERDYAHALQAFDDAVAADPNDAEATYYRGVTYGRTDRFESAAADLEHALTLRGTPARARLELGYALFRLGRYDEARAQLGRVQTDPDLAPEASLFLGIIAVRQGRPDDARPDLERAAADPRLASAAHYYQGLAAESAGHAEEARENFDWAAEHAPDTEIGQNARRRTEQIGAGTPATKRYTLYGKLGLMYDSNVVLAPSDDSLADAVGIDDEDDGAVTLEAGGRYDFVQQSDLVVSGGLEIFRSLHFDLGEADLQDHRAMVDVAKRVGSVVLGYAGSYDFYLRDTTSFLQEVSAAPWVRVPMGDIAEADIYYRYRYRDFIEDEFDGVLDGGNHAVGARLAHYFGTRQRYVALGYRYDHEDPSHGAGDVFEYDGNEVDAELGWTLPGAIAAELVYGFRAEDYASESNGRDDHEHIVTATLEKQTVSPFLIFAAIHGNWSMGTPRSKGRGGRPGCDQ